MSALTIPSPNLLLIVTHNNSGAPIASPSAEMSAWQLPIPAGSTANAAAAAFAASQGFRSGTVAIVIDLSVSPPTISGFKASWVAD